MAYAKRFWGPDGKIFIVDEVIQEIVGLTVHYHNEATGEKFSCLIDAFSERFREVQDDGR